MTSAKNRLLSGKDGPLFQNHVLDERIFSVFNSCHGSKLDHKIKSRWCFVLAYCEAFGVCLAL